MSHRLRFSHKRIIRLRCIVPLRPTEREVNAKKVRQQLAPVFARPFLFLGLFNRCPLFLLPVEAKIDNNKTEKTIECFFIFIFLSVTYSAYFKLTIPSKPQRANFCYILLSQFISSCFRGNARTPKEKR